MAGYTDALKYGTAQILDAACAVARTNGETWVDQPSYYINNAADAYTQPISICRMAALAKQYGTDWCDNGFRNYAGEAVAQPAVCGGPGPNNLPVYTPTAAAIAAKADVLQDIYASRLESDRSKKIIVVGIVLFIVIIIAGLLFIK